MSGTTDGGFGPFVLATMFVLIVFFLGLFGVPVVRHDQLCWIVALNWGFPHHKPSTIRCVVTGPPEDLKPEAR